MDSKKEPWGHFENIIGWPLIIIMMICPTIATLLFLGDLRAILILIAYFIVGLGAHSLVSCPGCRQRGVCYLGETVVFIKKLKK